MKNFFRKTGAKVSALLEEKPNQSAFAYYARNLLRLFFDHKITGSGAQLAFYLLLSLFPFLLLISSFAADANISGNFFSYILGDEIAQYLPGTPSTESSPYTLVGIIVVFYSVSKSLMAFSRAFNLAYGVDTPRKYFIRLLSSMLFVAVIIAFIIVSLVLASVGREFVALILKYFGLAALEGFVNGTRYVFALLAMLIAFVLLYKWVPDIKLKFREVLPGAAVCSLTMAIFSIAFSAYAHVSFSLSPLTSTIGAIMLLVLWLYIAGIIIILGAELNALVKLRQEKKRT